MDSRTEQTDSRPTPSAGASRKRGNASQSLAATRKRKTTDSSTQHGSKRQKTRPLTTADIPAIVKAARDGLPEPTETSQDSDDLEDTQDTDVAISDSSDEFGMYNLKVVYNCVCIYIFPHYNSSYPLQVLWARTPPPPPPPTLLWLVAPPRNGG